MRRTAALRRRTAPLFARSGGGRQPQADTRRRNARKLRARAPRQAQKTVQLPLGDRLHPPGRSPVPVRALRPQCESGADPVVRAPEKTRCADRDGNSHFPVRPRIRTRIAQNQAGALGGQMFPQCARTPGRPDRHLLAVRYDFRTSDHPHLERDRLRTHPAQNERERHLEHGAPARRRRHPFLARLRPRGSRAGGLLPPSATKRR